MDSKPTLKIVYCTQCKFLLRATWLAQEILTSFPGELQAVSLTPSSGGVFDVQLGDELLFSVQRDKAFPEVKTVKVALRDRLAPGRVIGH